MKPGGTPVAPEACSAPSIRIDRLLVYLRFARTRSAAAAMIEGRALRRNRKHVLRGAEQVRIGDVLTIALEGHVRVITLTALPDRRGPPTLARSCYREVEPIPAGGGTGLDPKGQFAIAAPAIGAGHQSAAPEDSL